MTSHHCSPPSWNQTGVTATYGCHLAFLHSQKSISVVNTSSSMVSRTSLTLLAISLYLGAVTLKKKRISTTTIIWLPYWTNAGTTTYGFLLRSFNSRPARLPSWGTNYLTRAWSLIHPRWRLLKKCQDQETKSLFNASLACASISANSVLACLKPSYSWGT